MKWLSVCVLFLATLGHLNCDEDTPASHFKRGLQIGSANDTSFKLISANVSELAKWLNEDDVKDREVVVISIAGTAKGGKSFLMNFFIRFLEANVGLIKKNFSIQIFFVEKTNSQ